MPTSLFCPSLLYYRNMQIEKILRGRQNSEIGSEDETNVDEGIATGGNVMLHNNDIENSYMCWVFCMTKDSGGHNRERIREQRESKHKKVKTKR